MQFHPGLIADVVVRPLIKHADNRSWLGELFRRDELAECLHPAMAYLPLTRPGVVRGPHEHRRQTDHFCFLGQFQVFLWDNRKDSGTFRTYQEISIGRRQPISVIIPPEVVHAYQSMGDLPGLVLNLPNQLYRGPGKKESVDEIRHEDNPCSPFLVPGNKDLCLRRL